MPVKIRLARHGKKGAPFYHIVVADGRAPRDGKFIEKIGTHNPNTNPATTLLDFDKALAWLQKGAQPTDTCRSILSREGVMYKNHLLGGVKKGAFSADAAEAKFIQWKEQKAGQVAEQGSKIASAKVAEQKARHEEEKKVSQQRAEAIAAKKAEAEQQAVAAEQEAVEEAAAAEGAASEEAADVQVELAGEAVEEAAAEVAAEEPAAEEKAAE